TRDGDCFDALTTAFSDCKCECAGGGHGDVCAPVAAPVGPPPPSLPSPPAFGECLSDMEYPEVAQVVGGGLSWLCYRNVTFSGAFMRLTVDIAAMTGDVANVTFDGCTWRDGASLVLAGKADSAVGSLNIAINNNTFDDAVLSPTGAFPPRTEITISGNRFTLTMGVSRLGLPLEKASSVVMNGVAITNHSAVVLSDNTFRSVVGVSSVICVVDSTLRLSWDSLFAVMRNTFSVEGRKSVIIQRGGSELYPSLEVMNNSAVVVQGNVVSKPVAYIIYLERALRVESLSVVVFQGNIMQGSATALYAASSFYVYYDSWVQVSRNLCRGSPEHAFVFVKQLLSLRRSVLSVSGNQFTSDNETLTVLRIDGGSSDLPHGAVVAACNTVSGGGEASYMIPQAYNPTIRSCSDPCTLAASCFPAYTTTATVDDGCACTCAEGGHGEHCLPVEVPKIHGGDVDPCVRDMNVTWDVMAGFGVSSVCYVGVTFAADVVVGVGAMSGKARNVTLTNCTFVGGASLYVVGWTFDPPAGMQVDVLLSGLKVRSGGGVLVANRYPPGSRVTLVDSALIAERRVAYRSAYDLGGASGCLVLYNLNLTGSVLTVARTQVVAVFSDAVGVLAVGGVALSLRAALYLDRLSVQTALGLGVSVEGGVTAVAGSVLALVDSDFLLCEHAVSVRGDVSMSGSVLEFVRSDFASTQSYAVMFSSAVGLSGGAMLLAKENVHDSISKELLYAAGAVTATGSTLSFVRNQGLFLRMLSVSVSLAAEAQLRVACNRADGRVLSTADEYAAAGLWRGRKH
ncbi:dispersed gene family protein 1 (DGF-1), partial [Trypanosoma rangeli]